MIAGALVAAATAPAICQERVKLLAGFEWEEYDGKLPRFHYLGKPHIGTVEPGWEGEKIERLEDVGADGFMIMDGEPAHSRHHPGAWMVRSHATQGRFAWKCTLTLERWAWMLAETTKKWPGAWPPHEPAYGVYEHFFQRECQLWRQEWKEATDWSGYVRLRFDVTSLGASLMLGIRVRDGIGPPIGAGPTGIRTALGLFTVPGDETVTCDFPLAEMTHVAELDLTKVHRYHIRVNGFPDNKPPTELFMDNIRLVAKGAEPEPRHKLVPMEGGIRPFARPVFVKPPTPRMAQDLKRKTGPVEPLRPVTINESCPLPGAAGHMSGPFGGSGATYFQNAVRAVVAYDNDRLAVVMAGKDEAGSGGLVALASFDGGRSWGGLKGEKQGFTILPWYLRAGYSADAFGDIYGVGTPNCDSYREGQDICLHRLAFTGKTWVDDRFTIVYQDGYKCPGWCRAMRIKSGRIWAAWHDGFGGNFTKCSDDDGYTWKPCKDASLEPPRPFHEPRLEDLGKVDACSAPKQVLLWPAEKVVGSLLVPYKGQVAVVSMDGRQWQAHDGDRWLDPRAGPEWKEVNGIVSVTVLGDKKLFLARSARYDNSKRTEPLAPLEAACQDGEGWKLEILEVGNVSDSVLTASGSAVYCFYVKKVAEGEGAKYEVRYRRWQKGSWEPSVVVATERQRINHVASPQICPSNYVCVLWDQWRKERGLPTWVRFARIPSR